jgi:hypothetical protein
MLPSIIGGVAGCLGFTMIPHIEPGARPPRRPDSNPGHLDLLFFIFYPIVRRERFDVAAFPRPPRVLKSAIGAERGCKSVLQSLEIGPLYLDARRELSPCDRAFYDQHAHWLAVLNNLTRTIWRS